MTCFLSTLYKTRSGCCVVVTIGNTNLDSESADHISLLPFFILSAIFSSKYFLNTGRISLCLHVKHSFKSKGHVYKICHRVPFLPHVNLSFSDIFNLIKLIGVGNTSYINCNKKKNSCKFPFPHFLPLNISLYHPLFPFETVPLECYYNSKYLKTILASTI